MEVMHSGLEQNAELANGLERTCNDVIMGRKKDEELPGIR